MINLVSIPSHETNVISRLITGLEINSSSSHDSGDETILVLPKRAQVKVLNETGSRIWELIDGERTVGEIVTVMLSVFDVERGDIEKDIVTFLQELHDKGLITLGNQK